MRFPAATDWKTTGMRGLGVWAIALVTIVAGLASAYFAARAPLPPPPPEKLTIALSSTPHAALLHLAAAKGYFASEGLDVTIVPAIHGKAALDMLAEGKADLAAAAELPFVVSVLNGSQLGIAATVVSVSNEMAVVARRDRGIAKPRDLAGKKVGVSLGTSGEYFLWAFLIRNKLPPDAITLVDMPPGHMARELASGAVDAVSTWQPVRFSAETALGDNGASFAEPDAYTVTHVVVGNSKFLQEHTSAVRKLVQAMLLAERYNDTQPRQALELVAERLKISPQVLQQGWQDLYLRVELRQSQLITLEDEARWAMARGYARKGLVPNFLPHLYLGALLAVEPERVTVVR